MTAEQRARGVEAVAAVLRDHYDSADDSDASRLALADLIAAARDGAEQRRRGTGGNRFIESDAGIPDLMRVIHEGLYELAEYDPSRPFDIAEVTITTRRIPSGRISVEVAADLADAIACESIARGEQPQGEPCTECEATPPYEHTQACMRFGS